MTAIKIPHLYKNRKVTEVIKDSFTYMNGDASLIIKLAAAFSFVFFIISYLVSYSIINVPPSIETIFYYKDSTNKNSLLFLILGYISFLLAYCMLSLAMNKLILKRDAGNYEGQSELFSEIKNGLPEDLKTYVLNFIIIYVIYYVTTFFLGYFSKPGVLVDPSGTDPDPFSYLTEKLILNFPTLLIWPLILYFGFSALFVSVRDNIGSTEALQKINKLSQGKYKKIWLSCALITLVAIIAEFILQLSFQYVLAFIMGFLEYRPSVFIYIHIMQKLISLGIFIFMQVGVVFLFGSLEDETEGHYIRKKIEEIS